MRLRGLCIRAAAALAACTAAALWCGGCGEPRPVVVQPLPPEPAPVTLEQIVERAKAGEGEWAIIWAVRQARRAFPLTTADIGRLREAGVTARAIDFMLETVTAVVQYRSIPMTVAEIVGLTNAKVPDDKIIAEIARTRTVFRLRTADVLRLREQGVSDVVIDFMLYTATLDRPEPRWGY